MFKNIRFKLVNSPEWTIVIGVFFAFCLANISYTGPTVLNDEIGYLANAALIAGYEIDGASKYHAGYSVLLAPLFRIFSEPLNIWRAAMVFNASIWALSFLLLSRILKTILPEYDKKQIFFALLISALYPAWITMSGYVFSTTAFVFVYLLSVLTFLHWKPGKIWTIVPHAVAVGYLFWIHPIGLAVCVASFITVSCVSLREKKYAPILVNFAVLMLFVLFYLQFVEGWLEILATPEKNIPPHKDYPEPKKIVSGLFAFDYWLEAATKAAGQISYLIISSFGFILFGFIASIKKSVQLKNDSKNNTLILNSAYLYLALSLMGAIAMGVMFFSLGNSTRIDQWIYGRYAEMVVLPLLALGYLSFRNKKVLLIAAALAIVTGLLLNNIVDLEIVNMPINTPAFWSQNVVLVDNYFYWMLAGSVVMILIVFIMEHGNWAKKLGLAIIAIVFLFTIVNQFLIHQVRLTLYGNPFELSEVIRHNYPPGTYIGFDTKELDHVREDTKRHKYHLHLFHLYDYKYRRMSPDEWLDNCDGPYLTFDSDLMKEHEGIKLSEPGKLHPSVYMLIKKDDSNISIPKSASSVEFID
ncbi:MAG: hypothetical protein ACOCQP_01355 [Lentisphaeria bacterium]